MLSGLLAPRGRHARSSAARTFTPARWLDPARGARAAPRARARRPPPARPGAALRGLGVGRARLPAAAALQPARLDAARRRCAPTPRTMMERYDVRPRDAAAAQRQVLRRQPAEARAGARGACREPRVLLVGQPTRGVDIGAIEFIHGRLRAMRDAGGAVLRGVVRARRDPRAGRPRARDGRAAASPASCRSTQCSRGRARAG